MSRVPLAPVAQKQRRGLTAVAGLAWGILIGFYMLRSLFEKTVPLWVDWVWVALLLIPAVVMLANRWLHRRLVVSAIQSKPFHEGERGTVLVTVKNLNPFPVADVVLDYRFASMVVDLAAHEERLVRLELASDPIARGHHPTDPVSVTTTYPFGLLRASRHFVPEDRCWVYPAIERNAPPWPLEQRNAWKRARHGEEVVGVRPYIAGDPMRLVDWKASARQAEVVVREFEEPCQNELLFTWDQVDALGQEAGLRRLTAWVYRAENAGLPYALSLPTVSVPAGRGGVHLRRCLEALTVFRRPGASP